MSNVPCKVLILAAGPFTYAPGTMFHSGRVRGVGLVYWNGTVTFEPEIFLPEGEAADNEGTKVRPDDGATGYGPPHFTTAGAIINDSFEKIQPH